MKRRGMSWTGKNEVNWTCPCANGFRSAHLNMAKLKTFFKNFVKKKNLPESWKILFVVLWLCGEKRRIDEQKQTDNLPKNMKTWQKFSYFGKKPLQFMEGLSTKIFILFKQTIMVVFEFLISIGKMILSQYSRGYWNQNEEGPSLKTKPILFLQDRILILEVETGTANENRQFMEILLRFLTPVSKIVFFSKRGVSYFSSLDIPGKSQQQPNSYHVSNFHPDSWILSVPSTWLQLDIYKEHHLKSTQTL